MTSDDARKYFFQQLPNVRHSGELLRLTQWVLPHLTAAPDRPLHDVATMQFRFNLEHSQTYTNGAFRPNADGPFRVWWSCNRNVATQLGALEPVFVKGSNGPGWCSGLTHKWQLANGPSHFASGLSLGPFAKAHAKVQTQLNAAQTVHEWWKTFLSNTPLWMRTAYNWNKPTPEQKEQLLVAKKTMLALLPTMVKCTKMSYVRGKARLGVHLGWPADGKSICAVPYWTALMSGQNMLRIDCTNDTRLEIDGMAAHAQALVQRIESVCAVVCGIQGESYLEDWQVSKALDKAAASAEELRAYEKLLNNLNGEQVFNAP